MAYIATKPTLSDQAAARSPAASTHAPNPPPAAMIVTAANCAEPAKTIADITITGASGAADSHTGGVRPKA